MSADSENGDETGGKRLKLKWLENPNHERARKSNKQERRVASRLGGRRIRNSGGARWSKHDHSTDDGDVATPEFHVEQKTTRKASMSLKREWLRKVKEGARKFGKDPAVVITFDDSTKPYEPPEDWILMPVEVAQRVLGYEDVD
jgi:Holliday junction resolvase